MLTQSRADRRSRIGLAGSNLQLNESSNLLGHCNGTS